jgi:hypothetical protein
MASSSLPRTALPGQGRAAIRVPSGETANEFQPMRSSSFPYPPPTGAEMPPRPFGPDYVESIRDGITAIGRTRAGVQKPKVFGERNVFVEREHFQKPSVRRIPITRARFEIA